MSTFPGAWILFPEYGCFSRTIAGILKISFFFSTLVEIPFILRMLVYIPSLKRETDTKQRVNNLGC